MTPRPADYGPIQTHGAESCGGELPTARGTRPEHFGGDEAVARGVA